MNYKTAFLSIILIFAIYSELGSYPVDGYAITGIRRLYRLQLIMNGEIKADRPIIKGAQKSINNIRLNLLGPRGDSLSSIPAPDPGLQKEINALFPYMHESYSIAILDITPGKKFRYAQRKEKGLYQPGSVGKLVVVAALFNELKKIYPNSFEKRQELLKNKFVRGGSWIRYDEHTVPVFDPETRKFVRRVIVENDVFSLYEWADHMLSASNNSAASVVWREVMLMNAFGKDYPALKEEQANDYFSDTPRVKLSELAVEIINEPIKKIGITSAEWKLGSFFTQGAKSIIPGSGGSQGSPYGLMKYLVALERGKIVDIKSSLEIKRLMYMTDRRIRYAASASLLEAAVYFKSGSLYQCKQEEGYECKKYMGNVNNYMNSVIIVEHPDGTTYMVVLMSNVLKKNSSSDHYTLAGKIDKILRKKI